MDNYQRVGAYVLALRKIEAPFTHPPTKPTNYAKAEQLLRTAVTELSSTTPPPQFEAAHKKLLSGQRGELATLPTFEQGQRTRNRLEVVRAKQKDLEQEQVTRAGLVEGEAVLKKCEGDRFSC